ncbi:MAG: hypothetical protein GY696_05615, partial [Gammaproteobacteria bacterium]|nr:hypothetical protein [Gammaproteobacteria bacterium]
TRRSITQLYPLESELEPVDQELINTPGRKEDVLEPDDLVIPESRTPGTSMPERGRPRIPESQTPGTLKPGGGGQLKPLESLIMAPGCKGPPESLKAPKGQATIKTTTPDDDRIVRCPRRAKEECRKRLASHFGPPGVSQADDQSSGRDE